mgnify:CR=1 FL=1
MLKRALTIVVVAAAWALAPALAAGDEPDYTPDPESLRRHEVPQWFEDAKLGYFIHWGPYSVPAYAPPSGGNAYAEWYWNAMEDKNGEAVLSREKARREEACRRLAGSSLRIIPGIGPKRRMALLRHFGSVNAIAAASPEAIQEVAIVSRNLAELIIQSLQKEQHENV